jgi:translin
MHKLDAIAERIHQSFEARTTVRDRILAQARTLTRHCANAIRAVHRDEFTLAEENLHEARQLVVSIRAVLDEYPDLYYAGYSQDALKEFAEANIVYAMINNVGLPTPEDLDLEPATYLQGLAEAVGEFRRRCLDALLHERPQEAEQLLGHMDNIYAVLVTMDYPDAITGGLRRLTDVARAIIERTRGDLTISLRQEHLEQSLHRVEQILTHADDSRL